MNVYIVEATLQPDRPQTDIVFVSTSRQEAFDKMTTLARYRFGVLTELVNGGTCYAFDVPTGLVAFALREFECGDESQIHKFIEYVARHKWIDAYMRKVEAE